MKRLDTTPITSTNEFPVKSGTLDFIQDAYKETFANLFTNLVPIPLTDTMYIISGCSNSGSGANYIISAGVLYLNGEIFNFDGATFTLSGLQKAYASFITTQYTTNADPVTFTDGISRNVHNIKKITITNTITSSGLPEFKDFVTCARYFKGETKEIVMDSVEYALKFVTSGGTAGLGLKEYAGWAVMNGNNDTENDNGLVIVAWGSTYSTFEQSLGSTEVSLVAGNIPLLDLDATVTDAGGGGGTYTKIVASSSGSTVAHTFDDVIGNTTPNPISLLQPSKARLRIQKI